MRDAVIGQLFGAAAGLCSICRENLFVDRVKIGEMAHIIAKKHAGPRGSAEYEGDINSYGNLILLCANHHIIVDRDTQGFPPERLLSIKVDHEAWVKSALTIKSMKHVDEDGIQSLLHFLPFIQLRGVVEKLPHSLHVRFLLEAMTAVENFPIDYPHCRPFRDSKLELHYSQFVDKLHILCLSTESPSHDKDCYVDPDYHSDYQIINKDLNYYERAALKTAVSNAASMFSIVYFQLMDYLRSSYPDVDMTVYR